MPKRIVNPSDTQRKRQARYQTHKLIEAGEIDPPNACEVCGAEPADLHHIDYSDPSRVMRLCTKHHMQTHSQFGKPAPLDWMADIRAAVARIEARRLAARSTNQAASSSEDESLARSP